MHAEKIDFLNMKKIAFVISSAVAALLCMNVQYGFSQNAGETKCDGEDMVIEKTNSKGDTSKTTLRVPEFDDGVYDVYAYLDEHVKYPESLEGQRAEGTCTVQFLVGADGSISQVTVARTSGYKEMDEEAVRVVKEFPNWKPAQMNGKAVAMKTQLPVRFEYVDDEE